MKIISLLATLFLSLVVTTVSASTDAEVEVTGIGKTVDEAKNNGFRTAIEQHFGSLLVATEESKNGAMVKDEILNYSAGYVKNYTVLKTSQVDGLYRLRMRVLVASSAIRDRVLSSSSAGSKLEGEKLLVQKQTFDRVEKQKKSLFNTVFDDYPKKAYNLSFNTKEYVNVSSDVIALRAYFTVKWNPKWVDAFNELMVQSRSNYKKDDVSKYAVLVDRKQNRVATWDNIDYHYFNENGMHRSLYLMFMQEDGHKVQPNPKTAYVKLSVLDASNNELDSVCNVLELEYNLFKREGIHNNLPTVFVKTFSKMDDGIGILIPANHRIIPLIDSVSIAIATDNECPNK
jgi:uncharacterized protein YxeA